MPPAGFEPTIPASERPQTHALDRATTGVGARRMMSMKIRTDACNLLIIINALLPTCD